MTLQSWKGRLGRPKGIPARGQRPCAVAALEGESFAERVRSISLVSLSI